ASRPHCRRVWGPPDGARPPRLREVLWARGRRRGSLRGPGYHVLGCLISRPAHPLSLPAWLPHRAALRRCHACPHASPHGIGLAPALIVRARTGAPAPHTPPSRRIVAAVIRLKIPTNRSTGRRGSGPYSG